jgi:hypothetical protein
VGGDRHDRAREQLTRLADELKHTHPGAAGSLRDGMEETLTVIRLRITGKLKRTLESTNPAESMIDYVRTTQRNVKHWSSGEMGLPWTAMTGALAAGRSLKGKRARAPVGGPSSSGGFRRRRSSRSQELHTLVEGNPPAAGPVP